MSLPVWGVWIEIPQRFPPQPPSSTSLPVWGVWIEMPAPVWQAVSVRVAPRMGSVD